MHRRKQKRERKSTGEHGRQGERQRGGEAERERGREAERQRGREGERAPALWLLFLYVVFFFFSLLPLGLPYVNWASKECCFFYLRSLSGPQAFLCSIFMGFSLTCLLATAILDIVVIIVIVNKRVRNAILGCNLKNDRMTSVHFKGKPFNIMVLQV